MLKHLLRSHPLSSYTVPQLFWFFRHPGCDFDDIDNMHRRCVFKYFIVIINVIIICLLVPRVVGCLQCVMVFRLP